MNNQSTPNWWKQLIRPILVLAPMADVTDCAFRRIIAKYGKPDVMFTEFVSADGLCCGGKERMLIDLKFDPSERPIVAQFFSANPEYMYRAALLAQELGFDGVDINMGCPDKKVCKQGSGAALIQNPALAKQIIRETKRGAGTLPVSVKTRLGYNKIEIDEWLPHLLEDEPAVITLHARTKKELSEVNAHWEVMTQASKMAESSATLIIGNGDVGNIREAQKLALETGLAGIMLGRAIFGNPWLFNRQLDISQISLEQKLSVLIEHTALFEKLLGGKKNFAVMKKHYQAYVSDFPGAKDLRIKLMECESAAEVSEQVNRFLDFQLNAPKNNLLMNYG